MRYTSSIKLMLPEVGSKQNWGTAINYNFSILDKEIQKILSEIANAKTLIGAGVPYYRELYDSESSEPYKFVVLDGNNTDGYTFTYYQTPSYTDESAKLIYYSKDQNDSGKLQVKDIPIGTGAYVLNNSKFTLTYNGETTTYSKGDLIVSVQQVGSISDASYVQNSFKKYPDTGYYIEPKVLLKDNCAIIEYNKKTYPDWVERDESVKYSAIPAFHFATTNIDTTTFTFKDEAGANEIGVFANFYIQGEGGVRTPVYIAYSTSVQKFDDDITVTIIPEVKPEGVKCVIYAGHSISAQANLIEQPL